MANRDFVQQALRLVGKVAGDGRNTPQETRDQLEEIKEEIQVQLDALAEEVEEGSAEMPEDTE